MPPLHLPGFSWDEHRKRYFPASLKPLYPLSSISAEPSSEKTDTPVTRRRTRHPWRSYQTIRSSHDVGLRSRMTEDVLSSRYASTSRCKHTWIPTTGRIRAFSTTSFNGSQRRFIGDDQGWVYACVAPEVEEQDMLLDMWLPDLILHPGSEITSICISGARCIATCLGPSARISVQDLNVTGRTSLLSLKNVHDIWAAHLEGNSLVIGADKRAVYLHDVDAATQVKYLETQSDVFAVHHRHNVVYTGARNGSITRFDVRLKAYGQKLYDERFGQGARSTVLHLDLVNEHQLLTSQMNGELALYDLRFPCNSEPLIRYRGHVNTSSRKLGIAIDPYEQFLFAAGEDCRVRGWSLNSGTPVEPPPMDEDALSASSSSLDDPDGPMSNPFRAIFSSPVAAMQLTRERKGICLWAASDEDMYRYHLGQQDDRVYLDD